MYQMSSNICSKSDWLNTINDADTRAGWATEAIAWDLTDVEFAYVLDGLAYYASLHLLGSNTRFSAADGTTKEFRDYAAILESVSDRQRDWYPDDQSCVFNLIDPLLFPLTYSRSKLCRQTSTSPQAARSLKDAGEFPRSLDRWRKALNITKNEESDYYISFLTGVRWYGPYTSEKFNWLPFEFHVDNSGAVTIESYINNLHPVNHCLVLPNILQYKVPELKLADKKMPGNYKMPTLYFVDPSTRILSTEIVPPQQQD
ncbi:hypothetical protein GGI17_006065 [Coemansia sp. S146]|nr:hypothetical protein GGI17_006065 [Coemansia sp. S146]